MAILPTLLSHRGISSYPTFIQRFEFCEDKEALLIIKTEKSKVDRIALPIVAGYDKYLTWVESSIEA